MKSHLSSLRRGNNGNKGLQRAFDETGENGLAIVVLERPRSNAKIERFEQAWLDECMCDTGICLNENPVADKPPVVDHTGLKRSDETRKRISESQTGRLLTPEWKAKIAESTRLALADPAVRKKISDALKGKPKSPEARANMQKARTLRRERELSEQAGD